MNQANLLRVKIWTKLLPEITPFSSEVLEIGELYDQGVVSQKDVKQILSDVRRCVNFHPLLRLDLVQKDLVKLLTTFLAINKDSVAYI